MANSAGRGGNPQFAIHPKIRLLGANGAEMGKVGRCLLYLRAYIRPDARGKIAKALVDDGRRNIRNPGFILTMIRKAIGLAGLGFVTALGVIVGGWVTNKKDPVQFLGRKVLTPVVKPGDAIKIELDNYRIERCAQTTWRIINKPDGERTTQMEDKPAAFGKLGRDLYIASIETPADATLGKASLYSYTERKCNPWEYLFPVVYGEWVDNFEFGPATKRLTPEQAKNTLLP